MLGIGRGRLNAEQNEKEKYTLNAGERESKQTDKQAMTQRTHAPDV